MSPGQSQESLHIRGKKKGNAVGEELNSLLVGLKREGDHEPRNVGNFLKMEEARFPTEPPE